MRKIQTCHAWWMMDLPRVSECPEKMGVGQETWEAFYS